MLFPTVREFPRPTAFTVAVVCSFDVDEPLDAILEAATRLPEVRFFVTGDVRTLPPAMISRLPPNVTLTGFLATEVYGGLLNAADVVLDLTTSDHTMLRGAYEAIYQGTPAIVSDWPVLREAFPDGAVHVANDGPAIAAAIRRVAADPDAYRAGARRLRARKLARWRSIRRALCARLTGVA